jgi:hypothetical protein
MGFVGWKRDFVFVYTLSRINYKKVIGAQKEPLQNGEKNDRFSLTHTKELLPARTEHRSHTI